ncbi:Collagen alpha-5(VI) chain [Manis javanica]|nr:Collagen alpha-5(VI) chain [Manis javanica]
MIARLLLGPGPVPGVRTDPHASAQPSEFDNSGTLRVIPVSPNGEYEPLERLQLCTLCYDKCFPNARIKEIFLPENSYMDVAFLLENSQNIGSDAFKAMKTLVSSMLDNFHIASEPLISAHGDKLVLQNYSPRDRKKGAAKAEFECTTYDSQVLMKSRIQTSLQQLAVPCCGPQTPNLRKHKVIFVVSAGENHEGKEFFFFF